MSLIVDLGALVLLLTLLVCALAVWRIGHVVSWRALAMTAWATHSFADCVAFIRYCVGEREYVPGNRTRWQQGARMIASTGGFFAACLAYMVGCERLQDGDQQQ